MKFISETCEIISQFLICSLNSKVEMNDKEHKWSDRANTGVSIISAIKPIGKLNNPSSSHPQSTEHVANRFGNQKPGETKEERNWASELQGDTIGNITNTCFRRKLPIKIDK